MFMTLKTLLVSVAQHETHDGTRRLLVLTDGQTNERLYEIYFDLVDEWDVPEPEVLDGFLFAIIFYAMRAAAEIHVQGLISLIALRNLREFQEAWHLWKPCTYQPVRITAEEYIATVSNKSQRAIAAFSGGVDSIFTTLRHAAAWQTDPETYSPPTYNLNDSVLMVHGFDVPLDRQDQLDALQKRGRDFLHASQLRLRTIRTNMKKVIKQNWPDSHAAQLACCLHNYSHMFNIGLVGSTDPYNALVLPWGSNPATDYLLSGVEMRTVHDGAGFTRTEKIARIAQEPVATAAVKVCWEGGSPSENCGRCEKCVRTQLAFKAAGIDKPACFETGTDKFGIRNVRLRNDVEAARMRSVLEYARERNIQAPWVTALERRLIRYRAARQIAPLRRVAVAGPRRIKSLIKAGLPSKSGAAST